MPKDVSETADSPRGPHSSSPDFTMSFGCDDLIGSSVATPPVRGFSAILGGVFRERSHSAFARRSALRARAPWRRSSSRTASLQRRKSPLAWKRSASRVSRRWRLVIGAQRRHDGVDAAGSARSWPAWEVGAHRVRSLGVVGWQAREEADSSSRRAVGFAPESVAPPGFANREPSAPRVGSRAVGMGAARFAGNGAE